MLTLLHSLTWIMATTFSVAVPPIFPDPVEVVVDNGDPGFSVLSGEWRTGSFGAPHGEDYRFFVVEPENPTGEVEWRPELPVFGRYEVAVWYVAGANRTQHAMFTVDHAEGTHTQSVNQQINGAQWVLLGAYYFDTGSAAAVRVEGSPDGVVIADAVRFREAPGTDLPPGPGEFRGMWVTRFEWPSTDMDNAKATIDTVMARLAVHRFNAVVFQVRGQADTLYPSPHEPWSQIIAPTGADPGWDPLQYAIDVAHARGLEFHAYINTHVAWQSGASTPPADPNHLYWQHCNAADPDARDWLIHNADGEPIQYTSDNYVWIAPGVPAAQAYLRAQVMHVVENYDVDGVHFDRIRTPGPAYSHDPISEARWAGEGNPDGLEFPDWTRDQFTRFLSDLYAEIMAVQPHVKVSAAPLGLYRQERYPDYPAGFQYGYSQTYQDAQAWMAAGALDFISPQIYWADGGSKPDFSDILPDWLANNGGRHIYPGLHRSVGLDHLSDEIETTRDQGGLGNVVFSYSSFNSNDYWDGFSALGGVYEAPAEVAAMPWKLSPATGILMGTVTAYEDGAPLVDAHVKHTDSDHTALSSADGLFAFPKVEPGTYTLTATKPGYAVVEVPELAIVAGEATQVAVVLGLDRDGDGTPDHLDDCPDDPLKTEAGFCGCGEPETDTDLDGTPDCVDGCPDDADKTEPGICGCGEPETDTDADGTPDCNDECPEDAGKIEAGVCGCGVAETDTDGDGTPDCNDECPEDADKIEAGICGCGVAETDTDGDGTPDCNDECPEDEGKIVAGACGCGVADTDSDHDGTPDCLEPPLPRPWCGPGMPGMLALTSLGLVGLRRRHSPKSLS